MPAETSSARIERNNNFFMVLLRALFGARRGRRFRQQRLDRRFPPSFVSGSNDLLANTSLAIDKVSCRQHLLRVLHFRIAAAEEHLVLKLRHRLLIRVYTIGGVVERGADDLQPLRLQLTLQFIQRGNLLTTWDAVRGPEVQQHHLALELLESKRLARE